MAAKTETGEKIVSRTRSEARHYLATFEVAGWQGKETMRGIACGLAIGGEPERYTDKPRRVTCAECRMHPAFAEARR